MATEADHRDKASHNQTCLSALDAGRFPDWAITVAFHTALHQIEAVLVAHGRAVPKCSHSIRNTIIQRHFSTLWAPYRTLYELSRLSRYECFPMNAGDVWRATKALEQLGQRIAALPEPT